MTCYSFSRILFAGLNAGQFQGLAASDFGDLLLHGLRYDISAICAINVLYAVLFLLPLPIGKWPRWASVTQILFLCSNGLALLFELADWAYFPYNHKRSTADVLDMVGRKGDFLSQLPQFLKSYWYVWLAAIALLFLFIKINKAICKLTPLVVTKDGKPFWHVLVANTVSLLVFAAAMIVGIRGGLQKIPIGIRNAVMVTESQYAPIVLNTPFSIITTYATPGLEAVHYMPTDSLIAFINPIKEYHQPSAFQPKNVVVIVLESFSREFTGIGGGTSFTPFLDSLMHQSHTATYAFANAQRSAEGLPAIIAGIPSFMPEPITTSVYGTNRLTSLPSLLAAEGYGTSFYHGGTNGTMSFDVFAAGAGYQKYVGRSEYNNEQDYDGNWGIWDEPFLQYFAQGLSRTKQPFFSTVFTLSSHPPYRIPDAYVGKLPTGPLPMQQCVAYTDLALRRFFEKVALEEWYQNTLFVITADHCSPATTGGYNDVGMGRYAIPMLYFSPRDSSLRNQFTGITQQIDILPSVMDYLHYAKPFFAYGNSIFRPANRYAVTENNGAWQWLSNGYLLQTTEDQPRGFYSFPKDSLCTLNLLKANPDSAAVKLQFLKAFMQSYRQHVMDNQLWLPSN